MSTQLATWGIAALATAGVIARPLRIPEAVWAMAGALALVALGLLPWQAALGGVAKGVDVYLFLTGMMLLAELARHAGLFDWLAAHAAAAAHGSAQRLFFLVYIVGTLVTIFLSNDATAVVLTPAVAAAARAAKIERPLPYLYVCAFIANAASFVLPISNPANLVIYAHDMPPLGAWLRLFGLPSLLSITATYMLLHCSQRSALTQAVATDIAVPSLSRAALITAAGIVATAIALTTSSAMGIALGLPTGSAGLATFLAVTVATHAAPWPLLREIAWGVLPLVAGLFVLVAGLEHCGAIHWLSDRLRQQVTHSASLSAIEAGALIGVLSNVVNNLPAGLIAGTAVQAAHAPTQVVGALVVGVDLGPNLSVTGSLATILWLSALRREHIAVTSWQFLKLGTLIMPVPLLLALATFALPR